MKKKFHNVCLVTHLVVQQIQVAVRSRSKILLYQHNDTNSYFSFSFFLTAFIPK